LELWDKLGIPHKPAKQVFGRQLTIIGFNVDPNNMVISILDEKKRDNLLHSPLCSPSSSIYPARVSTDCWNSELVIQCFLLKPSLASVYDKIQDKTKFMAQIYVNIDIVYKLTWLTNHMESLPGVLLLDSLDWTPDTVDDVVTIYMDAFLIGLAYWFPEINFSFHSHLPSNSPVGSIFFFEVLAICSAIHALANTKPIPQHLTIFTNNTNTVDIFNSL
jgi:hypothetical protein